MNSSEWKHRADEIYDLLRNKEYEKAEEQARRMYRDNIQEYSHMGFELYSIAESLWHQGKDYDAYTYLLMANNEDKANIENPLMLAAAIDLMDIYGVPSRELES